MLGGGGGGDPQEVRLKIAEHPKCFEIFTTADLKKQVKNTKIQKAFDGMVN